MVVARGGQKKGVEKGLNPITSVLANNWTYPLLERLAGDDFAQRFLARDSGSINRVR